MQYIYIYICNIYIYIYNIYIYIYTINIQYIYIYTIDIYTIYIYNKYFKATRHYLKFCVISDPQHTECSNLTEVR